MRSGFVAKHLLLSGALVAARHQSLRYDWAHSLYAPYISIDGKNSNWDFNALVSMHDFVQLTPEAPHRTGHVFSKEKFTADNWSIDFFFRITGHSPADGLAFWFSEDQFVPGEAFGYKENFKGLGVFFDVFKNVDSHYPHPWISAMVGDGMKRFEHENDGKEHALGGCHKLIANTQHPVQARVAYDMNVLQVSVKIEEGDWETCLTASNVRLPKSGYIGLTASTGALAARHDLLAITTAAIERDSDQMAHFDAISGSSSSSAGSSIFYIFALSGVAGLGYYLYQNNRKRHHF